MKRRSHLQHLTCRLARCCQPQHARCCRARRARCARRGVGLLRERTAASATTGDPVLEPHMAVRGECGAYMARAYVTDATRSTLDPSAWSLGLDGGHMRGAGRKRLSRHVLKAVTRKSNAHARRTLFLPCGLRRRTPPGSSISFEPICGGAMQGVQLPGVRMGEDGELTPDTRLAHPRGRRFVRWPRWVRLSLRHGRARSTAGVEGAARRPLKRSRYTVETIQRAPKLSTTAHVLSQGMSASRPTAAGFSASPSPMRHGAECTVETHLPRSRYPGAWSVVCGFGRRRF